MTARTFEKKKQKNKKMILVQIRMRNKMGKQCIEAIKVL